jgi:hypothetical protein
MRGKTMKRLTCASLLCVAASATLLATPITPAYTTFGPLSGATFGGTGIPNHAVAITTIGDVTLGLTAHARYSNPPVSNNGLGVFTAVAGGDIYTVPNTQPTWARWNFGWYASSSGSGNYLLELRYDFDPGFGTVESLLGKILIPLGPPPLGLGTLLENSWNLGMTFLGTSTPPWVTPPPYPLPSNPSFDPNVSGEYSFALILRDLSGKELGRAAILVNAVPDGGATLGLLGVGLLGLVALARRQS